jgi:glycosyltransferase involved in cell wall biosynthesis
MDLKDQFNKTLNSQSDSMKIMHLSTSDLSGGAARAAYRLHRGLIADGVSSEMLVQYKDSDDYNVHGPQTNIYKALSFIRPTIDHLPKILFPRCSKSFFHLQWLPNRLGRIIDKINPDILHLHWICRGFLDIKSLSHFKIPIVWTLHDNWPFTGGCHYTDGCNRFSNSCGFCPILGSDIRWDLSRWTWKRKFKTWKNIKIQLIAPCRWMKSQATESSLFKNTSCEIIPNGIDTERFKPIDKKFARKILSSLPYDKTLVLFGAMSAISDDRKGFQYLLPALELLAATDNENRIELVVLGAESASMKSLKGLNIHYIGTLRDEISIALVYAACDVFVAPSQEDNLPNTVVEAMSCGIPCVAFDVGGLTDLIVHRNTGYLAKPHSVEDLAKGINWTIASMERKAILSENARRRAVTHFDIHRIVDLHLELYDKSIPNLR